VHDFLPSQHCGTFTLAAARCLPPSIG
jgi:hypothetical protein